VPSAATQIWLDRIVYSYATNEGWITPALNTNPALSASVGGWTPIQYRVLGEHWAQGAQGKMLDRFTPAASFRRHGLPARHRDLQWRPHCS
jgi:hypothetical protein